MVDHSSRATAADEPIVVGGSNDVGSALGAALPSGAGRRSNLNIEPLSPRSADGHSGGVTPGLIPNPAVKPAGVPRGTEVRESTGSAESCQPRPLLSRYLPDLLCAVRSAHDA